MISGRWLGSIRRASRIRSWHAASCMPMLETMKRSGIRPSSRICDGRKFRFHCWRTMRVFVNPGVGHRRADRPDAGRGHARVGEDERQHSRAMIERAGDHGGQVVPWRRAAGGAAGPRSSRRVSAARHRDRDGEVPRSAFRFRPVVAMTAQSIGLWQRLYGNRSGAACLGPQDMTMRISTSPFRTRGSSRLAVASGAEVERTAAGKNDDHDHHR